MVVQLPRSPFSVRLELFLLEDVPIRSVTGQLAEADLFSTGSHYSRSSDSIMSISMSIERKIGVQADPYLISLHSCTGDADPGNSLVVGDFLAGGNLLHGKVHDFSSPKLVGPCAGDNVGSAVQVSLQSNKSEQVKPVVAFSSQLAVGS